MLAAPLARLTVGVNVAVYTLGSAVTVSPLMVPLLVVMSAAANPLGVSLKLNVIVAVSPALSALLSLLIVTLAVTAWRGDKPIVAGLVAGAPGGYEARLMREAPTDYSAARASVLFSARTRPRRSLPPPSITT